MIYIYLYIDKRQEMLKIVNKINLESDNSFFTKTDVPLQKQKLFKSNMLIEILELILKRM